MHSWASWYIVIFGLVSTAISIATYAKKNPGVYTFIYVALLLGLTAFNWFMVLPAGGFVW